jgi:diacylglycerol kinase family enzyme
MKMFHILHPSRRRLREVRGIVEARHLTAPYAWVASEHPDHTETLVQWALDEGVRRLVVWGGDGTLHRVVQALWERCALERMELALVPAGTCNDLARRMGLRFEEWPSWQAEEPQGRRAAMSLGLLTVGGRTSVFANNAGFGRPKVSFDRRDPAWRTLFTFSPHAAAIRWEAGELRGVYYMALFCLGPYFSGGLHFAPEPSPEAGEIRTFLIPARSKVRLGARLLGGRLGRPLADSKITAFSAGHLSVRTEDFVWPQVDGEPPSEKGTTAMNVSLSPVRWTLWTPD